MSPDRWQQINQIFHDALESSEGRDAYLARACAGDEELRREVASLLASHDETDDFVIERPGDTAAAMMAEQKSRPLIGRTLGRYEIRALLGAGGMGEVYLARDTRLDRDVAVKILPEHLAQDAEALHRFERE